MKNLYIKTYGCQMNEYDSSRISDLLNESHKLNLIDSPENADVILLNTCSIREKAEEKVFSDLGRLRKFKQKNPKVIIGVGGCVGSQEGDAIRKRAPYVDLVFGPQTLHRLPNMMKEVITNKKSVVDVSFPEIEKFDNLPEPRAEGPTAYVSIMEGCNKYCTYCIVPYTRGEEISRPFDDVIQEIISLEEQGVKEITLLGQNVNAYRGLTHDGEVGSLALLIHYINEIDGIERIRFTTSHPAEFSDDLIQAYAEVPKLVNHLHLPVQSGSDTVLRFMKRGYTAKDFLNKINKLKEVRPDISISSDFIVGFPNETEKDFMDTLNLVNEVKFDNSYSFIYSHRPGTPAADLEDNVDLDAKKQRLYILQDRLKQTARETHNSLLNTVQKILVTGPSKTNPMLLTGRTECNRVVNFHGQQEHIGNIIQVRIKELKANSLIGEVLPENQLEK